MPDHLLQNRFDELRERAAALGPHPDLDRPVSRWVTAHDQHLPQKFLTDPVRRLLDPRRWKAVVGAPGVGTTKLNRLLDVVARALDRAENPPAQTGPPVEPNGTVAFDPDALDEADWSAWGESIRRHRLDGLPLGRFAGSLNDLAGTLWAVPVRQFLDRPLVDLFRLAGMGRIRGGQVLRATAEAAAAVAGVPAGSPLACRPSVARVHGIACWLEATLAAGTIPDPDELDRELVRPLLAQLNTDLSPEHADWIRRRWGVDGRSATLKELGDETGQTREWVRQATDQAGQVLAVRWPEGRYLLSGFYELLLSDAGAGDLRAVVRTVAESCFGLVFPSEGTRRLSTRGRRPADGP